MPHKASFYEKYIKRVLDVLLSGCALIVLSPVMAVLAVLVRIKLGSPVIFSQERPGKHGRIFRLYKFRTMRDIYDENGEPLPDEQRLTSFGKKLRSTSLDELPELWNILVGDMSVVGPRPLLVRYLPRARTDGTTSCPGSRAMRRQTAGTPSRGRKNLKWTCGTPST